MANRTFKLYCGKCQSDDVADNGKYTVKCEQDNKTIGEVQEYLCNACGATNDVAPSQFLKHYVPKFEEV